MNVEQIRGARAMLGWSQKDLAEKSKVSTPTIKRLEAMQGQVSANALTLDAIRTTLEGAGIEFIASGETSSPAGSGIRFKSD